MKLTRFDGVGIRATASHLPARIVTTRELFDEAEELVRLTGVTQRHVADDARTSDLIIAAARPIIVPEIDRVLVATVTPDYPSPATAPLVQHGLGLGHVPAMDLSAACAGFVYALDLAARCVATGDRAVLVGAGERRFHTLARATPGVRVLFGDGACAALVANDGLRLRATMLGADGSGHGDVRVEDGVLRMSDGAHVFFRAVEGFVDLANTFLRALDLRPDDIDLVVPHQPNLRILERVARIVRIPMNRFVVTVDTVGNVGGASAGIALDRAWRDGRITSGMRILVLTAGAGYTAGAALLEAP